MFQPVSGMLAIDKLNKRVYTRRVFGLREWMGVLPGSQEVGTIAGSTQARSFYKKVPNCHSFAPQLYLHGKRLDVAPNTLGVFTKHTELYALLQPTFQFFPQNHIKQILNMNEVLYLE